MTRTRLLTALRWIAIAVVLGFVVRFVALQWGGVQQTLAQIAPASLALSALAVLLGVGAGTMSWVLLLEGLGPRVGVPRAAQVMLVGSLGKYVPGSVWAYLLQMELGRGYGLSRPRVLVASLYAAGVGVVASLLLGSLALPTVVAGHDELLPLFALLPIGLVCLHPRVMTAVASLVLRMFRREPLDHVIKFRFVAGALAWQVASYALFGLHLWLLANSLVDPSLEMLVLLTGTIALGFTLGMLAFVLPSGVGVREAILVGAMALVLSEAQATGITLVSRLLFTGVDLVAAGLAAGVAVAVRRRSPETG